MPRRVENRLQSIRRRSVTLRGRVRAHVGGGVVRDRGAERGLVTRGYADDRGVGAGGRGLRERGVTVQAVAGGLAIYLSIGLVFAWIIGFITHVDSTPCFAQHTNGTEGDRVYFSFTTLTTTGFGDFSAAAPAGHALAVIEELTGQLYLVTVIGLLIGSFVERRKTT